VRRFRWISNRNKAHYALTKIGRARKKLKAVVTQNIDGLHVKTGSETCFRLRYLPKHFASMDVNLLLLSINICNLFDSNGIPKCPANTFGIIRYSVLFDEWLNDIVFEGAQKFISECDLLLVIGSSLQVMPACNLLFDREP
jgi:NAD-dependent deacetylase